MKRNDLLPVLGTKINYCFVDYIVKVKEFWILIRELTVSFSSWYYIFSTISVARQVESKEKSTLSILCCILFK